ncbi:hypothetical protein ACMGE9_02625 [Macrococcus sp. EM39E]|uniref:hypothetical protein n=1 Tax=Macrococcus animalis TaxID=3395467 RepID=UPI0039BE69EA
MVKLIFRIFIYSILTVLIVTKITTDIVLQQQMIYWIVLGLTTMEAMIKYKFTGGITND